MEHCNHNVEANADWLAGDPVHRQLVSAPNSLIIRKNTGKFAKSGTICPK
jgi:hypothetical protein